MNVAVTAWGDRVSPVFDAAKTLLIAEIREGRIASMRHEPMNPVWISHLADRLRDLDVDVLICGAISQVPSTIIEESGIRLIPFVSGTTGDVLAAYVKNGNIAGDFFMPGCGRGPRGKGRRARGSVPDRMRSGRTNALSKKAGPVSGGQGRARVGKKEADSRFRTKVL